MKPRFFLGVLVFGSTALLLSGETPAYPKNNPPAAPKTGANAKKEEPMGVVEGIEIKRGTGYMGVAVVSGNFKITFYNEKRKPVPVPAEVARAVMRWNTGYQQKDEHAVLNPSDDGKVLTSAKTVKPPLNFRLFINLVATGSEEGISESYSIEFHG